MPEPSGMPVPSGMDCLVCLNRWRSWIRPLVLALYTATLLIVLPLIVIEFQVHKTGYHVQAWFIGGMFVLMAVPISIWGILQHLIHYTQPHLQRYIVRILWMVPIYAMNAWLALKFTASAIYLDTMRECYEAYVIYNFMAYLMTYLHSEYPNLESTIAAKPQVKHLIPFCCLPPWKMGSDLIQYCKHGALQYTVVRPVTTCIALICQLAGKYKEGDFDFGNAWIYLVIVNNISQIWAMYCLVLFYKAMREELAPIRPVWKFMCVKAVVFLSFWQAVLIAILAKAGVIKDTLLFSAEDVATSLQDFCICIEMFLAAVAHYYSFSHKPFIDYAAHQADCCYSFAHMWDVSDVREDVIAHVRHVGKTVTRPLRPGQRTPSGTQSERTPLLVESQSSDDEISRLHRQGSLPSILNQDEVRSIVVEAGAEVSSGGHSRSDSRPGDDVSEAPSDFPGSYKSRKSYTASMNNFAEFSDSVDPTAARSGSAGPSQIKEIYIPSQQGQEREGDQASHTSAAIQDSKSQALLVDLGEPESQIQESQSGDYTTVAPPSQTADKSAHDT